MKSLFDFYVNWLVRLKKFCGAHFYTNLWWSQWYALINIKTYFFMWPSSHWAELCLLVVSYLPFELCVGVVGLYLLPFGYTCSFSQNTPCFRYSCIFVCMFVIRSMTQHVLSELILGCGRLSLTDDVYNFCKKHIFTCLLNLTSYSDISHNTINIIIGFWNLIYSIVTSENCSNTNFF